MESLLEKIYNGKELITAENLESDDAKTALEEYIKTYNEFKKNLSQERLANLDDLLESHSRLENCGHQHYFNQGFSIGVRLLFEGME